MNRRGFFGALVGGVAALATGKLLPETVPFEKCLGPNVTWVSGSASNTYIIGPPKNSHPLTFTAKDLSNALQRSREENVVRLKHLGEIIENLK